MSTQPGPQASSTPRILSIIGIVCAVISLIIIPPLFGIAGAVLGFVGYAKGDKPLGLVVGIASIVAMVIGLVISYAVNT